MSVARLVRFLVGIVAAAILLAIVLPFIGVPFSRFLPPAHVWDKAQGYARGVVTDKFYSVTGNPFNVGGRLYFVDYAFYGKAAQGSAGAKSATPPTYYGQVKVSKDEYDAVLVPKDSAQTGKANASDKVAVVPGQDVRVKYEVSNPEINGTTALLENSNWVTWGGRSVTGAANNFSGWLVWVIVALALGYGIMLLLERFGGRENI